MIERILYWEGSKNLRDLGGLSTCDGHRSCFGAIVRGDSPSRLSPKGWLALHDYGIRTIVTLRTVGMTEPELDFTSPYADIDVIQAPIEDLTDQWFLDTWAKTDLWCTPLYYRETLEHWPKRHAAVITAIAKAKPGGVLFHCIRGNDRTGIIAFLLLALVGVTPDDIIADYELSPDPDREEILGREHSSVRDVLLSTMEGFDVDEYLRIGGATEADMAAIRRRLLE